MDILKQGSKVASDLLSTSIGEVITHDSSADLIYTMWIEGELRDQYGAYDPSSLLQVAEITKSADDKTEWKSNQILVSDQGIFVPKSLWSKIAADLALDSFPEIKLLPAFVPASGDDRMLGVLVKAEPEYHQAIVNEMKLMGYTVLETSLPIEKPEPKTKELDINKLPTLNIREHSDKLLEELDKETDPAKKEELKKKLDRLKFAQLNKKAAKCPICTQTFENWKDYNEHRKEHQKSEPLPPLVPEEMMVAASVEGEGPSGVGSGGDRPGIAVEPKCDESISLNAEQITINQKTWTAKPDYKAEAGLMKLKGYDIIDDQGKHIATIKTEKSFTKEQLEHVVNKELTKKEASLKKEAERIFHEGHQDEVLDRVGNEAVVYCSNKLKVMWIPINNSAIMPPATPEAFPVEGSKIEAATMTKAKTLWMKSSGGRLAQVAEDGFVSFFEGMKQVGTDNYPSQEAAVTALTERGYQSQVKQAALPDLPSEIRETTKAIDKYNYMTNEYDLTNGTKKLNVVIPLKETSVRMTDPTKTQWEKREGSGEWRMITKEEFDSLMQAWKEVNQKNYPSVTAAAKNPKDYCENCGVKLTPEQKASGICDCGASYVESSLDVKAFITHEGNEWCVKSEKGKNMGCYPTEAEAKKRLQQIHYFKAQGSRKLSKRDNPLLNARAAALAKLEKDCPECYKKFVKFSKEREQNIIKVADESLVSPEVTIEQHVQQIRDRMKSCQDRLSAIGSQKIACEVTPELASKTFEWMELDLKHIEEAYKSNPELVKNFEDIEQELAELEAKLPK